MNKLFNIEIKNKFSIYDYPSYISESFSKNKNKNKNKK
jgi:hypothetical protein